MVLETSVSYTHLTQMIARESYIDLSNMLVLVGLLGFNAMYTCRVLEKHTVSIFSAEDGDRALKSAKAHGVTT
jgi:hypothetical protein